MKPIPSRVIPYLTISIEEIYTKENVESSCILFDV